MEVGVHEAKTHFSALLRRVAAGEEVIIVRGSEPVAKLVPIRPSRRRQLGADAGTYVVPADFNAPLSSDELADFER